LWEKRSKETTGKRDPIASCNKECDFEVKEVKYKDVVSTIKQVYRHEGIMAFTKGVIPRMGINVPSTALSWGTYEMLKSFLSKRAKE
jgi:hypothetical protein